MACAMANRPEDFATWSYGTTTMRIRQEKNVDSGLWMLGDIEAWYLGKTHAADTLDMDTYRLVVRKAILSLPTATEDHDNYPIVPESTRYLKWRHVVERLVVDMVRRRDGAYVVPSTVKQSHANPLGLDDVPNPYPIL
jgi:hypothetical protein